MELYIAFFYFSGWPFAVLIGLSDTKDASLTNDNVFGIERGAVAMSECPGKFTIV